MALSGETPKTRKGFSPILNNSRILECNKVEKWINIYKFIVEVI